MAIATFFRKLDRFIVKMVPVDRTDFFEDGLGGPCDQLPVALRGRRSGGLSDFCGGWIFRSIGSGLRFCLFLELRELGMDSVEDLKVLSIGQSASQRIMFKTVIDA